MRIGPKVGLPLIFLPKYETATMSMDFDDPNSLYTLVSRLNNPAILCRNPNPSIEEFEQSGGFVRKNIFVPLYGTSYPAKGVEGLLYVGPYAMSVRTLEKLLEIRGREYDGFLNSQGVNIEKFRLFTSAEFKDDVMKELNTKYVHVTVGPHEQTNIEYENDTSFWLPDIVSMNYYLKLCDEYIIHLYVGVIAPQEIADAFLKYFESSAKIITR
jgi:hypothetical protein